MLLEKLNRDFTVCKIPNPLALNFNQDFIFLSKTDEENSLVCESHLTPKNTLAAEAGWKALRAVGVLDFGMVGVLAELTKILSEAKISVFVISTYNTDYIFLKASVFEQSVALLENNGYKII